MLKCPKCGSKDVEYYDCYDLSPEEDVIIQHWSGFCMECKADLLWEEFYKLETVQNVRIEKD